MSNDSGNGDGGRAFRSRQAAATATVQAAPARAAVPRRRSAPASTSPEGLPIRRRWGRFAMGASLVLLGGWVFASLYVSAGERVEVLAIAQDVDEYEEIQEDDLRVVRVAAEHGVETVEAGDKDEVVGRVAATELKRGSLLASGELLAEDARLIGPDEAVVPILLKPGAAPNVALEGGADVRVVITPRGSEPDADVQEVAGWMLTVGKPDTNRRERLVDIVVPAHEAATITSAAADGRVHLFALGQG